MSKLNAENNELIYEDFIKFDIELLMIKELITGGLILRKIFVFFSINNYKNGNFSEKDLQ